MSISTKRALSPATMNRVYACAIMFLGSARYARIAERATLNRRCIGAESVAYTVGALNRLKRLGLARNYSEALDRLESEQVGDRGSRITQTISADKVAHDVARINRINAGNQTNPAYVAGEVSWTHVAQCHMDNQSIDTDHVVTWIPQYPVKVGNKSVANDRSMGKVLGTLYTQWDAREAQSDPWMVIINGGMEANPIIDNLRRWWMEYIDHLSKTAKERLYELARSTDEPAYLMSAGQNDVDPIIRRRAWGAYRSYASFPHHDSLSGVEFIEQVRQYVTPPVEGV